MKKLSVIAGIFLLLIVASCRDVVNSVLDVLPPFNVPFTTEIEVPFAAVSTTTFTRTPEIPMNIDLNAKIKEQNPNYSIDNLKSVKLNQLNLEFLSSQLGNNLDVIKNANIYIKAPDKPELLIATLSNNTSGGKIIFTTTDAEMVNYFRTNKNSLIFEIMASRPSTDVMRMKLNSAFNIRVQL